METLAHGRSSRPRVTLVIGLWLGILSARNRRFSSGRPAADPRRRPDDAVVRLPHPGRRAVRRQPASRRSSRRDHLRRPAGHPARRGRHPRCPDAVVEAADRVRRDRAPAALEGPAAAVARPASCSRRTRASSWSSRWSSSAASSARARSATTSSPASPSSEDFGKGLAAGIAIVLLGIMLDRITQGAGRGARPSSTRSRRRPGPSPACCTASATGQARRRRIDDLSGPGGGAICATDGTANRPAVNRSARRRTRGHATRTASRGWRALAAARSARRLPQQRRPRRQRRQRQGTVKIAINPWVGPRRTSAVVDYLLEEQLGYDRQDEKILTEEVAWQGFETGEVDVDPRELGPRRTSRRSTSPTRRSPMDAGPNGVTGIIGWYVPRVDARGVPGHHRLEQPQQVLADMFKTSESGDKGQFLGGDPTFVTNDEALITNLNLNYKVVYSGSEAALDHGLPAGRREEEAAASATSTTRSGSTPRCKLVKVNLPPYTDRLRRRPQEGRLRLPAVHPQQDRQRRSSRTPARSLRRSSRTSSGRTTTRTRSPATSTPACPHDDAAKKWSTPTRPSGRPGCRPARDRTSNRRRETPGTSRTAGSRGRHSLVATVHAALTNQSHLLTSTVRRACDEMPSDSRRMRPAAGARTASP